MGYKSKVSIIVPVYNVERYLKRCVDSILKQSYCDFELILVEDGSPDSCAAICDEYAEIDKRVLVIHQENKGVSAARNAGIKIASGKYICFVDSDDFVAPEFISILIYSIEKNSADCSVCGIRKISEDGQKTLYEGKLEPKVVDRENSIKMLFDVPATVEMAVWNKLFLREIIIENHIQFDTSMAYSEDLYFLLQYFEKCKSISLEPEMLVYIVNRSTSETQRDKTHNQFEKDMENVRICCDYATKLCPTGYSHFMYTLYLRAMNRRERLILQKRTDELKLLQKWFCKNLKDFLRLTNLGLKTKLFWSLFSFGLK